MSSHVQAILRCYAKTLQTQKQPGILLDRDGHICGRSPEFAQKVMDTSAYLKTQRAVVRECLDTGRVLETTHNNETWRLVPLIDENQNIGVWITMTEGNLSITQRIERAVAIRTAQLVSRLEAANRLAVMDSQTGLMNRRAFSDHVAVVKDLASRHQRSFAVLMCDLDFFKRVNDNHGHGAGDDVLVATANALQNAVRASDKVARFGGEEFVVLLSETDVDSVRAVANRCIASIRNISIGELIPDAVFQQTMSIGVSIFPRDGHDIEELLERADMALYEAKRRGRDRVELYSPEFEQVA